MVLHLARDALHVTMRLRMVATSDDQFGEWKITRDSREGTNEYLQTLIGAPFSECEHTMNRVSAACEVWRFRPTSKDAVMTHTHRATAVLFPQPGVVSGQ